MPDPDAPANYSVRVSDDPKVLHLLYWGGCLVARCRTQDDLIAAIDAHLGGHGPASAGAGRLSGLVLRRGGDAIVLAQVDQSYGAKLEGRLRQDGVAVDVRPWIDVDVADLTLLPPGTVGLVPVTGVGPTVRALFLPAGVAELPVADRLMTMERSGVLNIEGSTLETSAALVRSLPTERVDDYDVPHVAESVRRTLVEFS